MSGDRELMAELGIDQMLLGDLVVINHADHRYGRGYKPGAVTIGLVHPWRLGHDRARPRHPDADDLRRALHRVGDRPAMPILPIT